VVEDERLHFTCRVGDCRALPALAESHVVTDEPVSPEDKLKLWEAALEFGWSDWPPPYDQTANYRQVAEAERAELATFARVVRPKRAIAGAVNASRSLSHGTIRERDGAGVIAFIEGGAPS
jgi:hypothetical protein